MTQKNKAVSGVIWSAIERFGNLAVQFLITVIIARALSPVEYGVMGILSVFLALSNIFLESGLCQSLIRQKNVNEIEYSTVFYFNLLLSLLLYCVLWVTSPIISDYYGLPILNDISRYVFLIIPINALSIVQNTIVIKRVDFKMLAKVSILSTVISGSLGIFLAYNHFGIWSLVIQAILNAVLNTVFIWIFNKWTPVFKFSIDYIKSIFFFSINILFTNVIIVLFNNIYTLVIGKFYNMREVGFYNQARRTQEIPSQSLTAIIQRVSYPVLSSFRDDPVKLKNAYQRIINQTMYVNIPLMMILLFSAKNLFLVLFSYRWLPAVPYFQLLCLYGAVFPMHSINVNILKVVGKSNKILYLEIARRVIVVGTLFFTYKHGISLLLFGNFVTALIFILINMYFCGKEIELSVKEQIFDVAPYFLISLIASGLTFFVGELLQTNALLVFLTQIITGSVCYIFLSSVFKLHSYSQIAGYLVSFFKKNN